MVLLKSKLLRLFAIAALAALILFSMAPRPALLGDKRKDVQTFALLKGTCFNERGFSVLGVYIEVTLPLGENGNKKEKRWQMQSDRRGEFAVRLPAGEQTVVVTASKKGYRKTEKFVQFYGDELQHIIIQMKPIARPE